MQRWPILLLLFTLYLIQSRPVTATAIPPLFSQVQPFTPIEQSNPLANHFLVTLTGLVEKADQVVRGQVIDVRSFWSEDRSIIESNVTIAVKYSLFGNTTRTITVRTPGGYLTADGVGMASPHAATYAVNEEVLIFIHQQGAEWRMVDGAVGKFLIEGDKIFNNDLALTHEIDGLLPTLVTLIKKRGMESQLPIAWRYLKPTDQPALLQPIKAQNRVQKWTTPHAAAAFYVNLNTTQIGDEDGDRAAFLGAIQAAAASWSSVANADFALTYAGETQATQTSYNGINEVLFMHKGRKERAAAAQVWYRADQTIVEADIWINDDYAWNAIGTPSATEVDLQSALLHEFGHWLILGHCADAKAVMFARLASGTLKRALQPPDMLGISAIYPE